MGQIKKNFITELLDRVDIVELIDSYVPLKRQGKSHVACCPFHKEKTPSFSVNRDKHFFHCFGCGEHGDAIDFLRKRQNLSFVEAVETLARHDGIEVEYERQTSSSPRLKLNDLKAIMDQACSWFHNNLKDCPSHVKDYISRRGLDSGSLEKYRIGYAPDSFNSLLNFLAREDKQKLVNLGLIRHKNKKYYDYFRNRLIFPIKDYSGRTIGFGGRAIGDELPKYLNSPESALFVKSRELYGLLQAKNQAEFNLAIVVEGYMDVVMLSQHGINNAVATLGTATGEDHVRKLLKIVNTVVFCFDGDKAGADAAVKAMKNSMRLLRDGKFIRFMFLPEGEDPDSFVQKYGKNKFLSRLNRAELLDEFLLTWLLRTNPGDDIESRVKIINQAKPLIRSLSPGSYADMLIQKIALKINMDEDKLNRLIFTNEKPGSALKNAAATTQGKVNLLHRALAILLRKPELAEAAAENEIVKQIPLLATAATTINNNKNSNFAAIHQSLGSDDEKVRDHLEKAYKLQLILPETDLEREFEETITNIEKIMVKQKLNQISESPASAEDVNNLIKIRRAQL